MKTIDTYITERLKLNDDSKINKNNEILGFKEFIDLLEQETTPFGQFIENYNVREYKRHKCYVQPADYRYYYVTETYPGVGQKMLEILSFPPNDIVIEYNLFDMDGNSRDSIDYRVIFNKEELPDKNWSYKYYKFKVKRSFIKPFVKFLNDIYDLEFQGDIVNRCQQFNRLCMNKKYFITQ